jgi:hypothetical protein
MQDIMFDNLRDRLWVWYHTTISIPGRPPTNEEEAQIYELLREHGQAKMNNRLLRLAFKYDLDLSEHLDVFGPSSSARLTPRSRTIIRKLVHEEKERRFENAARWVKLFAPLITAIAGLLGILIGLVAVWKK